MEDIISSLYVVAVTALVVIVIFWLVNRNKKKREEDMQKLASLNGWVYETVNERLSSGYRLRKGEWMIEALNETTAHSSGDSGSSNVASKTCWISGKARMAEGIVLIGPRQPEINLGNISSFLVQATLGIMIGNEAENAKDIHPIELGSLELMKRYMVWTNQDDMAKELLDLPVESALVNCPSRLQPVVKFSPSGLEVKIMGRRVYEEKELYALVKLGSALLDASYQVEKLN
jgi:hypothetical protein